MASLPWQHMFSRNGCLLFLSELSFKMLINRSLICSAVLFFFGMVEADFVKINWNASTYLKNSHFEREYKYPMYRDVAPAPCDLTDSCDVFCHQDTDCDESQKLSFKSYKPDKTCDDPLSPFDCACDKFNRPEWMSVFCYVFKNPVYLGKFFKTPKKIEKSSSFKNLLNNKRNLITHKTYNEVFKSKAISQLHSPIMTFVPMGESFPSVSPLLIKAPCKDSSYACESTPVRYRLNHSSACLTKITSELCQNGHALSVLPYLVQGDNMSANMPVVLKDLDFLKGVKSEISIKCVKLKLLTKKLKRQEQSYLLEEDVKPCDDSLNTHHTVLTEKMCLNVLVSVHHEFKLNGSDILQLKVQYRLADVPFSVDESKYDVNQKYIYLKQKFSVNFFDIMTNNKQNHTRDELLNRGYFVGEELNFGYKLIKNSSAIWEKGMIGVFKNGGSCDGFIPITFGFDYLSVCHIRANLPNCSQLRNVAEEKFEALLKGDSLAVNGNLRAANDSSVPLLRNYLNFSREDITTCTIPTGQDVLIQYTSFFTAEGMLVHRVLGIRIDRVFRNVTADQHVSLTSRVSFSYASSSKEKPLSRFWKKMLSAERSENSWLHISNAFDDVTPSERAEITFWSVLLVFLISVAAVSTNLNVSFDVFHG